MKFYNRLVAFAEKPIIRDLVLLLVRIGLGAIFWVSGRTKVEEGTLLTVSETTGFLFDDLYSGVPLPTDIAAPLTTYAEHALPLLLALGLLSRVSAAGLLVMTLVIQIFVFPDALWSPHLGWIAMSLVILTQGPGRLSLDHLIGAKGKATT